jgi:hypothetical protein
MQPFPENPHAPEAFPRLGTYTQRMLLIAFAILMLPSQWIRMVLPYYGDAVFGAFLPLIAVPYFFRHSILRGPGKWLIAAMVYGLLLTYFTRNLEGAWEMGWRELILDVFVFIALALGFKMGEVNPQELRQFITRLSWMAVIITVMNVLLIRLNYIQIDADASNRVVSVSLYYSAGLLIFLVPLQIALQTGIFLNIASIFIVGLVSYFTATRSVAIAFFLLLGQFLLLLMFRATKNFTSALIFWLFVSLPLLGGGGYYMLDVITESRGIAGIGDSTGRDAEFERFLEQMTSRGWLLGNGLGTGFQNEGFDPDTGASVSVIASGLHFTTLTPVLKFGVALTVIFWLGMVIACVRLLRNPFLDPLYKAAVLLPINYLIIYSISGAWGSSSHLILGLGFGLIFALNARPFAPPFPPPPMAMPLR